MNDKIPSATLKGFGVYFYTILLSLVYLVATFLPLYGFGFAGWADSLNENSLIIPAILIIAVKLFLDFLIGAFEGDNETLAELSHFQNLFESRIKGSAKLFIGAFVKVTLISTALGVTIAQAQDMMFLATATMVAFTAVYIPWVYITDISLFFARTWGTDSRQLSLGNLIKLINQNFTMATYPPPVIVDSRPYDESRTRLSRVIGLIALSVLVTSLFI